MESLRGSLLFIPVFIRIQIMDGIEMVTRYRLIELEAATHASDATANRSALPLDSGSAHAHALAGSTGTDATHESEPSISDRERRRPLPPRALPIVGMSANSDAAAQALATQAGMTAFLPKPFSRADVQAALAPYQK